MATKHSETGPQRQRRLQHEQHRPEQNRGYDEAVRGGASAPPLDAMDTVNEAPARSRDERRFDEAAREAANDVRRHDKSAD